MLNLHVLRTAAHTLPGINDSALNRVFCCLLNSFLFSTLFKKDCRSFKGSSIVSLEG